MMAEPGQLLRIDSLLGYITIVQLLLGDKLNIIQLFQYLEEYCCKKHFTFQFI